MVEEIKSKILVDIETNNMERIFEFQWRNELNRKKDKVISNNKVRTYYTNEFMYEQYLDMLK